MTVRWTVGSASMASEITCRVSAPSSRCSGISAHERGEDAQWPGQRAWSAGRNRSASTDGSSDASSAPASDENGTLRASRTARVFARFVRIRKSHVLSDERPSKRSIPAEHAEPGLLHDLLGHRPRRTKSNATRRSDAP